MTELRKKGNSNFKEKQERKKERYEELAEKNHAVANENSILNVAGEENTGIPMGQPILVGHHSEKRHRAHLKRIDAKIEKGINASKKADYYENKAESVGRGGILSDDPEAIVKLKEKIERLEKRLATTKAINKVVKKKKFKGYFDCTLDAELTNELRTELLKVTTESNVNELLTKQHYGRRYSLDTTYISTPLRQAKKRLQYFIEEEKRESIEFELNGVEVKEEDGYINVYFPDKPNEDIRKEIKGYGIALKWSRYKECWTRKKTQNVGDYFIERLKDVFKKYNENEAA